MPLFKELTKPFRAVLKPIPIVGRPINKILRETARLADYITSPIQHAVKDTVNEVAGIRKRENKRLSKIKAELTREAQEHIANSRANEESNLRATIVAEINEVRTLPASMYCRCGSFNGSAHPRSG